MKKKKLELTEKEKALIAEYERELRGADMDAVVSPNYNEVTCIE